MYQEDDLVPLSALQHVLFCERQCALIHVERAWTENRFTAEGRILHERAHSKTSESRPGVRTEKGMPIRSLTLGIAGMTDVVEFHQDGSVYPVEYKRGRRKRGRMDEVQLCAQAICLEEMLQVRIPAGALYYGKERRRKVITFDEQLRQATVSAARRVHEIIDSGVTPAPVFDEHCRRCSFFETCKPTLFSINRDVQRYVDRMAAAEPGPGVED